LGIGRIISGARRVVKDPGGLQFLAAEPVNEGVEYAVGLRFIGKAAVRTGVPHKATSILARYRRSRYNLRHPIVGSMIFAIVRGGIGVPKEGGSSSQEGSVEKAALPLLRVILVIPIAIVVGFCLP